MVYGKFHRYHYQVLDQNAIDNSNSALLRHKFCNVDHKKVMQGIDLCYNNFSHLRVQHQNYPESDTVCMFIFIPLIVYCFCPYQ